MSSPPPDEIIARAKSGDARAQYILAASLSRAGKREEAETWLQSAAANGEPDALYTLATRELQTIKGVAKAVSLLSRAADAGGVAAARLLAVLGAAGYGAEPDLNGAITSVLSLAKGGDASAQREIAGLLFLNDPESANGSALLEAAVEKDLIAAVLAVSRRIAGRRYGAAPLRALARLDEARYPRTLFFRSRLSALKSAESPPKISWENIAEELRRAAPLLTAKAERLLSEPDVQLFAGAVPPELLEYIIAHSAPRLAPSTTVDPRDGTIRRDAYRTSLTATLGPVDQDLAIIAVNRRIAALAGADHQKAEFLSVLRYAPGEEYRPHFDWLPPGPDFDRGGQRARTALLYLNDDYEGGETHFVTPGLKVRGKPGDLLVFSNVLQDGSGDKASRHAGLPVRAGHKWLGSTWFRDRRYEF